MTTTTSPPAQRVGVRRATAHDAARIAHVLADALVDDPFTLWILPRPHGRRARLERVFRDVTVSRVALPHDATYTTRGAVDGAALWMPPGTAEASALQQLRMLPALLRSARRDAPRIIRGIAALDAAHPPEPHWYLTLTGVAPAAQGRGIGSALLRPVLQICDGDRVPAYLEATTERNRRLYERHGFEVRQRLHPDGGPTMWAMWRDPR